MTILTTSKPSDLPPSFLISLFFSNYDTHSRINNYLIGILFGVIMREPKYKKFPFSKLVNLAIWCVVLVICISFNLYYHNVIRIYEHTKDTLFYGLYRPVWCFSLAWMVYSCHHGYGGFINWILSLPMFQIGARLSYCMYLLHALVIAYWVGVVRTSTYWGDYVIVSVFIFNFFYPKSCNQNNLIRSDFG